MPNPQATGNCKPNKSPVVGPTVDLYLLDGYIYCGPLSKRFWNKRLARIVECRADNTLAEVHEAFFKAFDRKTDRPYEFNVDVDWYHFISLEKIEKAIPTVDYPRVRRRIPASI